MRFPLPTLAAALLLPSLSNAAVVGPGPGIPHEALDTGGTRTNVDFSAPLTLGPGTYNANLFSFAAGQAGQVQPFLATSPSSHTYNVIAAGQVTTVGGAGNPSPRFGPSATFTLNATTTIYAGITNPGTGNPVYLDDGTANSTDHNGSGTTYNVGDSITSFTNPNLGRQYAFNVEVGGNLQIGPGSGILATVLDTAGAGPRTNVDLTPMHLLAGQYKAVTFDYNAGRAGDAVPFLAVSNGTHSYQVIATGSSASIGGAGIASVSFGGLDTFTLASASDVFVGFTGTTDNPILLQDGAGLTDHDNATLDPVANGNTVAGFSNTDLTRRYAFSVTVAPVPEPASLSVIVLGGVALLARRRTRRS